MTIFKNGLVVDGSGKDTFVGDVCVEGDRITEVRVAGEATGTQHLGKQQINGSPTDGTSPTDDPDARLSTSPDGAVIYDISGMVICPGFIDAHAHSDLEVLRNPGMGYKIMQGITTDISGNCGVGVFPKHPEDKELFPDILGHFGDNHAWTDFNSYKSQIHSGMNIAFLQAHANLRRMAIGGDASRSATREEIKTMCKLLDRSLDDGAVGFSSGIFYAPNVYASREEFIELLKIVRSHNKLFCVHHRCEGSEVIPSIREVLDFCKETGARLEISHLKIIGMKNQNKMDTVLEMIDKARSEGMDVAFDSYPYEYGSTSLFSLLPPDYLQMPREKLLELLSEASESSESAAYKDLKQKIMNPKGWDSCFELCGPEHISIVVLDHNMEFAGLTLVECAERLGKDVFRTLFQLLATETGAALMADVTQSRENLLRVARHPLCVFGTDALYVGGGSHPRSSSGAVHYLIQNVYRSADDVIRGVDYRSRNTRKDPSSSSGSNASSSGGAANLSLVEAIHKMTGLSSARFGLVERGLIKKGYFADLVVFNPHELSDNATLESPFEKPGGIRLVMVNGKVGELSGRVLTS